MRIVDVIEKKKAGSELTRPEIEQVVLGYVRGDVPDYQVSAWLMAICWKGMSRRETLDLTSVMVASGAALDLSRVPWPVADKHSSGGVGDKTSLVVAPLARACGVAVGKMSGRGLGFTGGTIDKLESIPGYRVDLSPEEFVRQLESEGIVLSGQTADLAPADGKLYALRDVTGTIASLPLIASSIMSKKLAAGASGIVLDVKYGSGAFMAGLDDAKALATLMVGIGADAGRRVSALLTPMNQPLGMAVGNSLEVAEAIDTLKGRGPSDLRELAIALAGEMVYLAGAGSTPEEGAARARGMLESGGGLEWLRTLISAQGGDPAVVDDPELMGRAPLVMPIASPARGWITRADARGIAAASLTLGAGRAKKGDPIDHQVGIILRVKVGDRVDRGDLLAEVHARDERTGRLAAADLGGCFSVQDEPADPATEAQVRIGA